MSKIDIPALDQQMRQMSPSRAAEKCRQDMRNRMMSVVLNALLARTCLSCGAKTDHNGEIPCGH
jgi:hypothetical protein